MKRTLRLLGLAGLALGAVWFVRTRRPDDLRDLVTHRFDPLVMRLGLVGGRHSPWATIEHVGRISGTTYRTPIYARIQSGYVYIRLPYGSDVHWVRNIRAAGHCRVQYHETIVDLDEPAIIHAAENPMVPAWAQGALGRSGRSYLRLHILDRAPGTFTRDLALPAGAHPLTDEPPLEVVHPTVPDTAPVTV